MPRPKRTKVAPSTAAPRVPRATTRATPGQRKLAQPSTTTANTQDEIEDIVVTSVHNLKGKGKKVAEDDGVSRGRVSSTARQSRISVHQDAQNDGTDLPSDGLGDGNLGTSLLNTTDSIEVEVSRRDSIATANSVLAIGNFRRRARQPSILGRGPQRGRSSSVESDLAVDHHHMGMESRRASGIAIGTFKRHPRQPSIIGRATAARSSSIGLETDIGTPARTHTAYESAVNKRRARESNALRAGIERRNQHRVDTDDDEDDFAPEDESTPLNKSKMPMTASSNGPSASNPRKRKLTPVEALTSHSPLPTSETRGRTRSITGSRSPPVNENIQSSQGTPEPQITTRSREGSPALSDIMAQPLSSSPPPSFTEEEPQRIMTRGRQPARNTVTPAPYDNDDSPISSPPALTHSPNRRPGTASRSAPRRQQPIPATFSTAQLQALLPRRRHRPNTDQFEVSSSDDEIDVSGLSPNDDELTHLTVHPGTRRRGRQPVRPPAPLRRGPKSKTATAALTDKSTAKTPRKYGSAVNTASDKENEDAMDPDDSLAPVPDVVEENSQELERRIGKELKKAARKFAEVDKWELEFEDVTASSSSPIGGR